MECNQQLLSTPFHIISGTDPTSRRFDVHSGLLKAKSKLFGAILGDHWKDCAERASSSINLSEYDDETMARFVAWMYTGDYFVPFPKLKSPATHTSTPQPEPSNVPVPAFRPVPARERINHEAIPNIINLISNTEITDDDEEDYYTRHRVTMRPLPPLSDVYAVLEKKQTPASIPQCDEYDILMKMQTATELDFTDSLIDHTKLFFLATYTQCPELETYILRRILQILLSMGYVEPDSPLLDDIFAFSRYVYQRCPPEGTAGFGSLL